MHDSLRIGRRIESTEWFPTKSTVNAQTLEIKLALTHPQITFNDSDTLILSVAIEFGVLDAFGNPTPMKGGGAGKILGVG